MHLSRGHLPLPPLMPAQALESSNWGEHFAPNSSVLFYAEAPQACHVSVTGRPNRFTVCMLAGTYAWTRSFSNQPEDTVYGGPSSPPPKRVTLRTLAEKYSRGENISMVTAYDYPSAVHVSSMPALHIRPQLRHPQAHCALNLQAKWQQHSHDSNSITVSCYLLHVCQVTQH